MRAIKRTVPATGLRGARPSPPANQPPIRGDTLLKLTVAGLLAAVAIGCAVADGKRPARGSQLAAWGAALVASSVAADSAMEHYRGNYRKGAMNVAPMGALITMATAITTALSCKGRLFKSAIFGSAITTGLFGLGFHFKNILERPGRLSFNNLFYRAPFGAPGAMILAGASGLCAVTAAKTDARCFSGSARRTGRSMGIVTVIGLFGLATEVGLLHFRGAFQNRLMYAPVVAVPLTGAAMAAAMIAPSPKMKMLAREMLASTMGLGVIGTGLHSYGVSRGMGGFANWTQNLFQGPPIPAPPSLAGIGLMGLAALDLLEPEREARAP